MFLSVIIPTRNRSQLLAQTLKSISAQTYPKSEYELIVFDNGSTDGTKDICNQYKNQFKNFRYFYDDRPGLHVGRNTGAKIANGNILVYGDDDIEAFPTWLEGLVEGINQGAVIVGGKILPKFEVPPPEWLLNKWETDIDIDKILPQLGLIDLGEAIKKISPYYIWGGNCAIKKEIVFQAKGYHPDSMPEHLIKLRGDGETHVSKFIADSGYQAIYNPKASIYHIVSKARMNSEFLCKCSYRQGISDSYTLIRLKGLQFNFKIVIKMAKDILKIMGKADIDSNIKRSYWYGFKYHRKAVKKDRDLYNWIKKIDYL